MQSWSPLEIGGVVGAALVGAGAVAAWVLRLRSNGGGKDALLREAIRDLTETLRASSKTQEDLLHQLKEALVVIRSEQGRQSDKQVTLCESMSAIHRRLDLHLPARQP